MPRDSSVGQHELSGPRFATRRLEYSSIFAHCTAFPSDRAPPGKSPHAAPLDLRFGGTLLRMRDAYIALTFYVLRIRFYALRITHHASRFTFYASQSVRWYQDKACDERLPFTFYVLRFTHHCPHTRYSPASP